MATRLAACPLVSLSHKEAKQICTEELSKYWGTQIALVWGTSDVITQAESLGYSCDEAQAVGILNCVLHQHDAARGVCWETFNPYIEDRCTKIIQAKD